jgi:hypothetical protein
MKPVQCLPMLIFCIASSPSLAEVYRWKDDSGKIVFGDTPPKDKTATAITIENTEDSGAQFATPGQVKLIEQKAENRRQESNLPTRTHIDSHCRGYVSQLNKIEIYLQHTPTNLDQQKASDLRKLIKIECGNQVLSQKYNDWQCQRYRTDLNKAEIFHQHTPTPRDEQKIKDLKTQIAHECQ